MAIDWSRVAIVTAADAGYARFADGLVRSLRDAEPALGGVRLQVHVLDVGLGSEDRRRLAELARVVDVIPPLPMIGPPERHPFLLSRMVKPFLPSLVPGYAAYLWLDADAWVQVPDALVGVTDGLRSRDCVAVPEIDPAYRFLFDLESLERRFWIRRLFRNCERKEALHLSTLPAVNSGVVAARPRSALWPAWQRRIAAAFAVADDLDLLSDQAAMNAAIYLDRVPFRPLPAELNWLMSGALPRIDRDGFLCTPQHPRRRIGICHMTHLADKGPFPLRNAEDARVPLRLDYVAWRAWRDSGMPRGAPP